MAEPPPRDIAVAAVQLAAEQAWADPDALRANTARIRGAYLDVADDVDLVVFPELSLTGYIPLKGYDQAKKRALAEVAREAAEESLPELTKATQGRRATLVVGLMEPTSMRNEFFNSVALIEDGTVGGVYRKAHLPVEENHYFTPGSGVTVVNSRIGCIALIICYDMLFPEFARQAALEGAELLVVASNWLDIGNLERLGEILPVARALEGQHHVIFVNGVGDLEVRGRTWSLYGKSAIVSATGEIVARAGSGPETLTGTLSGADLEAASSIFPVLRDRRPDLYTSLIAPATSRAVLPVEDAGSAP